MGVGAMLSQTVTYTEAFYDDVLTWEQNSCIAELHKLLIYLRVSSSKELMFASSKGKLNPV